MRFPSGRCVAHCAFEITLSLAITLTLLLVCAFFSTQVQKYLAWDLTREPCKTNAEFLSKRNKNEKIFFGQKGLCARKILK